MGITKNSLNTFMYSTDGFKSKTFSSDKLHKKVFKNGKNTQTYSIYNGKNKGKGNININIHNNLSDALGNNIRGKSHKRGESIRNLFESQIVFS